MGKPKGGIGSNQYQQRGSPQARPTAPIAPAGLISQVEPTAIQRMCGEVWGSNCKIRVSAPNYRHDKHPGRQQRIAMASDVNTPSDILETFVNDPDDDVRRRLARRPNTPHHIIEILARDPNDDVRQWVADNTSTPASILEILANDPDEDVRYWVARRPNTPVPVLENLLRDPAEHVADAASINPGTPAHIRALYQVNRP